MNDRSNNYEPLVTEDGESNHTPARPPSGDYGSQPTVELPSGGLVPRLGLGTWQLDDDEAERIVAAALDMGVRHVDTAQMYGNESGVGAGVRAADVGRESVFVTTKIDNDNHEPEELVASVQASLDRLGFDYVDLLLVHWPVEFDRMAATLAAMANVQAAGMCRHLGVSNFTVEQLDTVVDMAPLEVLQVECHLFLQQEESREWCRNRGWAFTAYSPLARGEVADDQVIAEIASQHDASEFQVALAWLLAQPNVVAIPRSGDIDHVADNWAARGIDLSAAELDSLASLDRGQRLIDPDQAPW